MVGIFVSLTSGSSLLKMLKRYFSHFLFILLPLEKSIKDSETLLSIH